MLLVVADGLEKECGGGQDYGVWSVFHPRRQGGRKRCWGQRRIGGKPVLMKIEKERERDGEGGGSMLGEY